MFPGSLRLLVKNGRLEPEEYLETRKEASWLWLIWSVMWFAWSRCKADGRPIKSHLQGGTGFGPWLHVA